MKIGKDRNGNYICVYVRGITKDPDFFIKEDGKYYRAIDSIVVELDSVTLENIVNLISNRNGDRDNKD